MELEQITEGDFAGWSRAEVGDSFTSLVGPYYYQTDEQGKVKAAFKAEPRHLNAGGSVHGGCLLTLADTSLFIFSIPYLNGGGAVTMSLDAQFLSPGRLDDIIVATGEVTRAGATTLFVRGQLMTGERLILTYSGVLKRTGAFKGDS